MTTDVKLLPLPRTLQHADDADLATHVQDYARANVAHATEPLKAEIERLRAERDSFQRVGIREQERAEKLAEALDAVWRVMPADARYLDPPDGGDVPLHEQVRRMAADAARAERLAEALRGIRDYDPVGGDAWLGAVELLQKKARAALHDHDQEGKDG